MVIFDKRKDKGADGRAGKDGAVICRAKALQLRWMIGTGEKGNT
ncbi:hypothetical protein [Pseudomonas quasicaspiana]|nr:hypothetical protein [Pseudomonas quasicaspiana]